MTVAERIQAEEALGRALDAYAGEWVAVLEHSVIAHAPTLDELLEQIKGQEEKVEVFRVSEDRGTACFF
jgi:Family of unknown function (DUF5678)